MACCCSARNSIRLRARALVEVVVALEHLRRLVDRPPRERADRLPQLTRAPERVALPERDRARQPGRGRDDHAVAADLLDPPGRRAEQERLAGPRLVDHLLVELADPPSVGQRDREQPAVGDRAGVRDRQLAGAGTSADRPRDPVPDDPRPQLGELARRIAAVEHVEHVLKLRAAQLGVRVRPRHERVQLVDVDRRIVTRRRRDRDDLLGEHVERVARHDRRLDLRLTHPPRDDRALQQVGAELREDPPAADVADRVAGPADPLQPARDRLGRLDLDHEVDRAHVDPQLQRSTSRPGTAARRPSAAPRRPSAPHGPASRGASARSPSRRGR